MKNAKMRFLLVSVSFFSLGMILVYAYESLSFSVSSTIF